MTRRGSINMVDQKERSVKQHLLHCGDGELLTEDKRKAEPLF